ncbi:MAG: hypothetical protein H6922_03265 [Pseudomonadaceae bacterium]|nr:hypothetical protein [Pseudomonadaceae bacterium]
MTKKVNKTAAAGMMALAGLGIAVTTDTAKSANLNGSLKDLKVCEDGLEQEVKFNKKTNKLEALPCEDMTEEVRRERTKNIRLGFGQANMGDHNIAIIRAGAERHLNMGRGFKAFAGVETSVGLTGDKTTSLTPSGVQGYDYRFQNEQRGYVNARGRIGVEKEFGRLSARAFVGLGYMNSTEIGHSATVDSETGQVVVDGSSTKYKRDGVAGEIGAGIGYKVDERISLSAEASASKILAGRDDYDGKPVVEVTGHANFSFDCIFCGTGGRGE